MDNTKRALAEEATEKEIPRAAYEGVLTIDVDAQVESMEEQEDARWHQLLNAHRTRKVLTGQLGGIEKLESGWMVAVTYYNGFRIIIPMNVTLILSSRIWMPKAAAWWLPEKMPCSGKDKHSTLGKQGKSLFCIRAGSWRQESLRLHQRQSAWKCLAWKFPSAQGIWPGNGWGMPEKNSRWEIWSLLW